MICSARINSLRELREAMRDAALQWRRTPTRQFRKRAHWIGRAVFYRESHRILRESP